RDGDGASARRRTLPQSFGTRRARWHARESARAAVAFERPSQRLHVREDRTVRGVAVIGRAAQAVVVQAIQHRRAGGTRASGIDELQVERDVLVLPRWTDLEPGAFGR